VEDAVVNRRWLTHTKIEKYPQNTYLAPLVTIITSTKNQGIYTHQVRQNAECLVHGIGGAGVQTTERDLHPYQ
jgi:hypothetical protein